MHFLDGRFQLSDGSLNVTKTTGILLLKCNLSVFEFGHQGVPPTPCILDDVAGFMMERPHTLKLEGAMKGLGVGCSTEQYGAMVGFKCNQMGNSCVWE